MTRQSRSTIGLLASLKRVVPQSWRRAWRQSTEARSLARLSRISPAPRALGRRSLDDLRLQLVGFLSRASGVGAAARGLLAAARSAGLPVDAIDCEDAAEVSAWRSRLARPDVVNLLVLNPDALARLAARVGAERLAESVSIGHWVWELERFPARFLPAARLVREIWTPTRFVQAAIARSSTLPVRRLPYAVVPRAAMPDRAAWGWGPDEFVGLTVCDLRSEAARKSPQSAIAAYRRAFPLGAAARLVVKVQNVDHDPAAWRELLMLAGGRPDIQFINQVLDERRMASLFASCDLYVSLHRSEGFGLCLAEAMAQGKPVLATAYSGSCDFVTFETGCPVSYRLVAAPKDFGPYPRGAQWAEAVTAEAAIRWRELAADRDRCARLGRAAKRRIAESYAPRVIGQQLRARLADALDLAPPAQARIA